MAKLRTLLRINITLQCAIWVTGAGALWQFSEKNRIERQMDRWTKFVAAYSPFIMQGEGVMAVEFSRAMLPKARLTDAEFQWFLTVFPAKITVMGLGHCDIGDASVELLCARNDITEITLSGTNISERSLLILDGVKSLQTVRLNETKIEVDKLEAFKKRHEEWEIWF